MAFVLSSFHPAHISKKYTLASVLAQSPILVELILRKQEISWTFFAPLLTKSLKWSPSAWRDRVCPQFEITDLATCTQQHVCRQTDDFVSSLRDGA